MCILDDYDDLNNITDSLYWEKKTFFILYMVSIFSCQKLENWFLAINWFDVSVPESSIGNQLDVSPGKLLKH